MSQKIVNTVITLFLCIVLYNCYSWMYNNEVQGEKIEETTVYSAEEIPTPVPDVSPETSNDTDIIIKKIIKKKKLSPFLLNACSILDIFYVKPPVKCKNLSEETADKNSQSTSIAIVGIISFLVALALNAVFDVMKAKEEELKRRSESPNDYRRGSLAEFANKKPLRRESSKFGLHLFQIAEAKPEEEKAEEVRKPVRPYNRGESTNSYLSEKKSQEDAVAPLTTASETPTGEPKVTRKQLQIKLIGARPVTRRSSFPVLNDLNSEINASMLARSNTIENDDDSDGKGRRVRLIRRY